MEEQEATPSPRRSSASSPEFSFWPSSSLPTTTPHSAEDLFSNGILLPTIPTVETESKPNEEIVETETETEYKPDKEIESDPIAINPTSSSITNPTPTSSKRWKGIFKVGEKEEKSQIGKPKQPKLKPTNQTEETKNRLKPHKTGLTGQTGSPEISINIWPFGRSRSAGTAGSCRKPTGIPPVRKSSSAPCSRSNSRGESGKPGLNSGSVGRKWAASPGRPGVHVGRSSPVWHVKRTGLTGGTGGSRVAEPVKVGTGSNRVINLSVNSCIGYGKIKREGKCERNDNNNNNYNNNNNNNNNNNGLFGIKGLFSKKVH